MAWYNYKVDNKELSFGDRCEISQALDAEYRGEGINIDVDNIADKLYQALNINKLKDFATYMCTYRRVVDLLSNTYTRPPTRYFRTKNGKPVSIKLKNYLDNLFEELHFDDFMDEVEADTTRGGTTFVAPIFDEEKIRLLKLTPSVQTLNVKWNKQYIQEPVEVKYTIGENDQWVVWLKGKDGKYYKNLYKDSNNELGDLIKTESLELDVFPWVILRFITDVRRSWGPVDQTSWSFHKTRSLLLAKLTEAPMHEMYQLLLMQGFSEVDALAAIKTITSDQTIIAEPEFEEGTQINKDVKYIQPSAVTPQAIWEVYDNIYSHYLITKGISRKNFETSNDPQSAAAQRQSDKYLADVQTRHKRPLAYFEKELFERIKQVNNAANLQTIPDDVYVVVDWKPDPIVFNNAKEKVVFYQAGYNDKTLTPLDKISMEKGVSKEEAQDMWDDNKKWFEEYMPQDSPSLQQDVDDTNEEESEEDNPVPKPREGESKEDFIKRFMSNELMVNEYKDEKQRLAAANQKWQTK